MTPYFERGGIVIYHGDAREVLPTLEAASVDLVFTSPPYNICLSPGGCGRGFYTISRGGRNFTKWKRMTGYGTHSDAMPLDEYRDWQRSTLSELWRIVSDRGAIFYNHKPRIVFKQLWLPLDLNPGLPLHQIITWDRGNGIGLGDTHYCPAAEWLMIFSKPHFALTDRSASSIGDVWRIPVDSDKHGHPAPFPVALPGRAMDTTQTVTVLDPFAGVGNTLIAAAHRRRPAIGIEIEERYAEIAANRLSQEVLPLTADPIPQPEQLALVAQEDTADA